MAGAGRKLFTRGILSSADVQGYLMDQAVQQYASASARTAALGATPDPGLVTYLEDSDRLELRSSAGAWRLLYGPGMAASETITVTGVLTGWTVSQATGQVLPGGTTAYVDTQFTRTGAAVTTAANGDLLPNLDMGTIPAKYAPASAASLGQVAVGRVINGYVNTAAMVRATASGSSVNILTGDTLQFAGVIPLGNP